MGCLKPWQLWPGESRGSWEKHHGVEKENWDAAGSGEGEEGQCCGSHGGTAQRIVKCCRQRASAVQAKEVDGAIIQGVHSLHQRQ